MKKTYDKILTSTFICTFILFYLLRLNFFQISGYAIFISSLFILIYFLCIFFNKKIINTINNDDTNNCTNLNYNQLTSYYNLAFINAIAIIIFSLSFQLSLPFILERVAIFSVINVFRLFSSLCFGFFSLNFIFIWIIFNFTLTNNSNE